MLSIGSDHGGFQLKEKIIEHLSSQGIKVNDHGTYSEDSVDYPDVAAIVCQAVACEESDYGILVCGTGIGMSIAANKIHGIRAAVCENTYSAQKAIQHNNANILCLGQRVLGEGLAFSIVDSFLDAFFEGERHQKRIDKIMQLEEK